MLRIKVGATSANVCVGFDVLGLALDIYNTFTFEKSDDFSFKGFNEKYCNKKNNLVFQSYKTVFNILNKELIPVEIGFQGNIPVSRGLGSSSSLIVAGVFAANHMLGNPLDKEELFNICADIEGHPDNVAPAIYGGLVATYKKDNAYHAIKYDVSKDLKYIVVIPPFELATHKAREVLPKVLPYSDIVHNMSRIVNLPKAFETGDIKLISDLFDDKLHEPYRSKLIDGYDQIKKISKMNNAAFAISGSGSTMLIIANDYNVVDSIKYINYEIRTPQIGSGVEIWEE